PPQGRPRYRLVTGRSDAIPAPGKGRPLQARRLRVPGRPRGGAHPDPAKARSDHLPPGDLPGPGPPALRLRPGVRPRPTTAGDGLIRGRAGLAGNKPVDAGSAAPR